MPAEITMPQLSDTMTEGTVVKWHKQEGDKVKAGEKVADVETDKAVMEMESFEGGTLAHVVAKEGAKVPVGGVIAIVAKATEKADEVKSKYVKDSGLVASATQSKPAQAPPPDTTPQGTLAQASNDEIHENASVGHGPTHEDLPAHHDDTSNTPQTDGGDRIRVSPLARRIAKDKGIDLSQVTGSGPGGRVIQRDVENFKPDLKPDLKTDVKPEAAASTPAPVAISSEKPKDAPARLGSGEKQAIPLTKMRATIAQRLQQAKQQIPHIYLSMDIDMEAVNALREKLNASLEKEKVRLSVADFISKAVAVTLLKNPAVNAHFDDKNQQIIRYGDVHLGNAVALPDGLIVPVLRNVHLMGLKELRQRSVDLFDRAKAQKLKRDELSGATFTITNLGIWGVKDFCAIVNPPEVAILAVSASEKRAVVRDGQVVARSTMTVTLSTDHRAVDGATAADFLKTLKGLLEEPGMMLV